MKRRGRAWSELRENILSRDDHACQFCFATDTRLDIHHITPTGKGGDDSPDNLITLCSYCHARISRPNHYGLPIADLVNYLAGLASVWGEEALPAIYEVAVSISKDDLYLNKSGALCVTGVGILEPQAELLSQIAKWLNEG